MLITSLLNWYGSTFTWRMSHSPFSRMTRFTRKEHSKFFLINSWNQAKYLKFLWNNRINQNVVKQPLEGNKNKDDSSKKIFNLDLSDHCTDSINQVYTNRNYRVFAYLFFNWLFLNKVLTISNRKHIYQPHHRKSCAVFWVLL